MQALGFIYSAGLGPKVITVAVAYALRNWSRYYG